MKKEDKSGGVKGRKGSRKLIQVMEKGKIKFVGYVIRHSDFIININEMRGISWARKEVEIQGRSIWMTLQVQQDLEDTQSTRQQKTMV